MVALGCAALHIWGITETPERNLYWFLTAADLLVAAVAAVHASRWPRHAVFEEDALVLGGLRVPYHSITSARTGYVSAKPFWLAFWLPNSLVIGLVVAARNPSKFNREVVEVDTNRGRVRARWRDTSGQRAFVDALREVRPEVSPTYGLDGGDPARDCTPRLGVPGGLLACALSVWALVAGLLSLELTDRSTYRTPASTEATSAALRTLAAGFRDYETLPGVPVDFRTWRCDRANGVLGPTPHFVRLHLVLEGRDVPTADAVEAKIRQDAGMPEGTYLMTVDEVSGVRLNIPASSRLSVWVSTGCVDVDDAERLRGELRTVAAALGVR
nr:hypothetical protein GCM10017745_78100 [Saccharothrix mutabilis subsp. capreolus]